MDLILFPDRAYSRANGRRIGDDDGYVYDAVTGFTRQDKLTSLAQTQDANSFLIFLLCIPLAAFVWVMFKAMWFWKAWSEFLTKTGATGSDEWTCHNCGKLNSMAHHTCMACNEALPQLQAREYSPEPIAPLQASEIVLVLGLKAAPQFNGTQATVLDPGYNNTGNVLIEFENGTQAYVKIENVLQVMSWTIDDVATWMERVNGGTFAEVVDSFADAGVDGETLLQLDDQQLRSLTPGRKSNRKHLRSLIEQLRPPKPPQQWTVEVRDSSQDEFYPDVSGYKDALLQGNNRSLNPKLLAARHRYGATRSTNETRGWRISMDSYPSDQSMQDMFTTFHLSFKHLTLHVPDRRVKLNMIDKIKMLSDDADVPVLRILNDVSGYFEPGTLTAIMGPSGCGKTTLLTLLSGRIMEGRLDGTRMVNGEILVNKEYDQVMSSQGYVQQFDTFFNRLTVMEELTYAAMLRLPDSMLLFHKFHRIQSALREVGLSHRAEANIGGGADGKQGGGLSGGERRRLSVAIELLRMPSLIFLDEPTSGLDASSSLSIIKLLKNLADGKRTIVTTIHQPRTEIFRMFDKILLMDRGGRVLFLGSPNDCYEFVKGAERRKNNDSASNCSEPFVENPADLIIDAVQKAQGNFHHLTKTHGEAYSNVLATIDEAVSRCKANKMSNLPISKPPKFITQTWVLFARRFSCVYPSFLHYMLFVLGIVITELIIALAFSYDSDDSISPAYKLVMFLLIITSYGMVLQYLTLVPEYFIERPILFKDLNAGVSREDAYVLGVFLTELPTALIHSSILIVFGMVLADMNTEHHYAIFSFLTMLVGILAWQAVISAICVMTDSIENVYTIVFGILGLGCLFGGIMVSKNHIIKIFLFAYYMSVPALTTRAIVQNDLYCCHLTMTCEQWLEMQGIEFGDQGDCPSWLVDDQDSDLLSEGNLGRAALDYLGFLDESKVAIVFTLAALAVVFRLFSILILKWRRKRAKRLHS